ncbi:MAG TPA: hypothetical protein VFX21_11460, partial [Acidimicrobiia bacterium]|nr:hypothetical protein [Acidimicrobiia bacterium]
MSWNPPEPAPAKRSPAVPIVIAVVVTALIAGGLTWFVMRDDDNDNAASSTTTTRRETTTPDTSEGGNEDDPLSSLDDLLGGDAGDLGGLLGGNIDAMSKCVGADDMSSLLGGGDPLPDTDPRTQYQEIAQRVEEERGLTFDHVPEPVFVDSQEMQSRVERQIEADYPADAAQADEELYKALGVIDDDTNLLDEYSKFVGSQVAGYYDPDTGELVVLGDDTEPFDALEMTTIAHELEHALADQKLGFPIEDTPVAADEDKQMAGLALIEGDATLTMTRFQLSAVDLMSLLGSLGGAGLDAQTKALEDAPRYFASQLMFPYTEGLGFVCTLEADGGWPAVDDAYENAPTTTAQIMFPDRYTSGEGAVAVPDPQSPGDGWEHVRTTTFGAAELMFLLQDAFVNEPRDRAAAWAGGKVSQWRNG